MKLTTREVRMGHCGTEESGWRSFVVTLVLPYIFLSTDRPEGIGILENRMDTTHFPHSILCLDLTEFDLPNPNGKEGGACISSLLQVLYERGHEVGTMSWISVLEDMWEQLKRLGYEQIPQLSSSRWIDVYRPMMIVPPNSGKRRAMVRF